jgi:hypothetical protein
MIASNDIKTILLNAVKADTVLKLIPEIKKDKHKPVTETTVKERIVVVTNATNSSDWQKTYARVLIYVPDVVWAGEGYKAPNTARLTELERVCVTIWKNRTFTTLNGDTVYYRIEDITQDDDPETWSHYLNVRLKFVNQNFKI